MWAVYLAALVVSLGVLVAQAVMGDHHGAHGHGGDHAAVADDAVALFLSSRFWIFFALAFGLSGALLTWFALASPGAVGAIAGAAGAAGGLFASLAFRALRRASISTSADAREAAGQVGRVLIACGQGRVGKVRIELKGQSVDLMATTDAEGGLARGDDVLVESVRGEVAHVSARPKELA
jgi:membrane protein implicated in regulation of membrane protease activity